jgi:hypothetical protein
MSSFDNWFPWEVMMEPVMMEPVVCSICVHTIHGRLLWSPNKILHQDKEKTNIQTKVPPILLMARIIAKKKHERERERERERSMRVYLSMKEGSLFVLFVKNVEISQTMPTSCGAL